MEIGSGFLGGLVVGVVVATVWHALRGNGGAAGASSRPRLRRVEDEPAAAPAQSVQAPSAGASESSEPPSEIEALLARVDQEFERIATPEEAWNVDSFRRAVELLKSSPRTTEELVSWANSPQAARAMAALDALRRRGTLVAEPFVALATALSQSFGSRAAAHRYLCELCPEPVLGRLIGTLDPGFTQAPWFSIWFSKLLRMRASHDELEPDAESLRAYGVEHLKGVAASLHATIGAEVATWKARLERIALELEADETLSRIGKFVTSDSAATVVAHPALAASRDEVLAKLDEANGTRRSILIVGGPGVGKSSLIASILARRIERGDSVFEASAADVIAGQRFVGEHEERVKKLLAALATGRKRIWVIPRFQEIAYSGRSLDNPTSTLDLVLPAIERGEIQVIGEASAVALERLLRRAPRLRSTFEIVRLEPIGDREALALGREVLSRLSTPTATSEGFSATSESVIREAQQLANAHATDQESPGRLISFLRRACEGVLTTGGSPRPLSRDDLLTALSRVSGLPKSILDESARLDLAEPTAFFSRRVLGQDEAVRTLVDRIGMFKAGLCDARRPIGVYLFTGPTGTGKTELAKALAEYLFGSPERMLRYDMSEFQSPDSLDRLVGSSSPFADRGSGAALVDRIREQPFAVVLLDEFEKAHPSVFDLFLQLFDDGRLTDRQGNVADFRHAFVIMTSNLGGDVLREASIGFGNDRADPVARAMTGAFRKEFINRIDRVVAFQPLSRAVMRDILMKELAQVLERRGLRNRQWAFEWETSAIDFLLDRGFTHDLGARPLRRAIEQHLLAPLARTILEHKAPSGDQFLFVRSVGDRLEVEFVDPDASPDSVSEPRADALVPQAGVSLRELVLDAAGDPAEFALLAREFERISSIFHGGPWKERKQALFDAMGSAGFWSAPERFATLEEAEYRDRLEVGFASAESLWQRLSSHGAGVRDRAPPHLLQRLAHDLYLLDEAIGGLERGEAPDAWLLVEAEAPEGGAVVADAVDWSKRILSMYTGFCERRRMRLEELAAESSPQMVGGPAWRRVLAISGFAAYAILRHEHGLHVLEVRTEQGRTTRLRARVRVLPQPPTPPPREPEERAAVALAAFDAASDPLGIARRYTETPSPLVRDAVRSWRTGRIDRVLAGDFDLF